MGKSVEITRLDRTPAELRKLAAASENGDVARRLLAIAQVLEGVDRRRAAEACGMDRQTLRDWVHRYNDEGVEGLASRKSPGVPQKLSAAQKQRFIELVEAGPDIGTDRIVRWRRVDLARKLLDEFGVVYHERAVGKLLASAGFVRLSVRPQHPKSDPAAQEEFKKTSPRPSATASLKRRAESRSKSGSRSEPGQKTVRGTVFPANASVGQQGSLTRIWARKGTRPRAPRDRRYAWAYIFGAACPQRGVGAAVVMPYADTCALNAHLEEIARLVAPGAHAVLILDGAGYHIAEAIRVFDNLTLVHLPPYSPELNAAENIWEWMRKNKLANRVFDTYEDILDACCDAWTDFTADPKTVSSVTNRDWATVNL